MEKNKSKEFTVKGVSFKMILVQGGTFTMGATPEQDDAEENEKPAHPVTLPDYYIGETPVTQALWDAMEPLNPSGNPSEFEGEENPVEFMTWYWAAWFIEELSEKLGYNFDLPTEQEWEFAARGGNLSKGFKYAGSNNLDEVAWYQANSGNQTHPVKQKKPNELGLYDMCGNVWEWCKDYYFDYGRITIGPGGRPLSPFRTCRGGDWSDNAKRCRVSTRYGDTPDHFGHNTIFRSVGFRLALHL